MYTRPNLIISTQKDTRSNFKSIHDREIALDDYETRGHYEIDSVLSGDKKGGVLTVNHCATMRYYVRKAEYKRANTVNKALRNAIEDIGGDNVSSITSDN